MENPGASVVITHHILDGKQTGLCGDAKLYQAN